MNLHGKQRVLFFVAMSVVVSLEVIFTLLPTVARLQQSVDNGFRLPVESSHHWRFRYNTEALSNPNLGARHPNGSMGMVVEPSVQRLQRRNRSFYTLKDTICPSNSSILIEGNGGNQVLQKVRNGIKKSMEMLAALPRNVTRPKLLCMVYTVYMDSSMHENLRSIANTWGQRCDGFIAASNLTDHSTGAINLPHLGLEEYANMWQKIRTMWSYAYQNYLEEFDYFYICGDDTYVAVDNLRAYLHDPRIEQLEHGYMDRISSHPNYIAGANISAQLRPRPLVFGTPMMFEGVPVFAGGAGYLLNRAALRLYGHEGVETFETTKVTSQEDFMMALFFASKGVYQSDTKDADDSFRFSRSANEAFHFDGVMSPQRPRILRRMFGFGNVKGIDSCSEQRISFHLKSDQKQLRQMQGTMADLIVRYHAILYDWCRG